MKTVSQAATPEVLRAYVQLQYDRGRLDAPTFAEQMKLSQSMVHAIIRGERKFPMYRVDEAAQFFDFALAEDFIRAARTTIESGGKQDQPPQRRGRPAAVGRRRAATK